MSSVAGFNFCWMVGITQKISLDSTYARFSVSWRDGNLLDSTFAGFNICWIHFAGFNFCWVHLFAGCIVMTAITSAVHGAVFHDSHHFSSTWNSLGWLSFMTAIIFSTSLGSIAHDFCTLVLLDSTFAGFKLCGVKGI